MKRAAGRLHAMKIEDSLNTRKMRYESRGESGKKFLATIWVGIASAHSNFRFQFKNCTGDVALVSRLAAFTLLSIILYLPSNFLLAGSVPFLTPATRISFKKACIIYCIVAKI